MGWSMIWIKTVTALRREAARGVGEGDSCVSRSGRLGWTNTRGLAATWVEQWNRKRASGLHRATGEDETRMRGGNRLVCRSRPLVSVAAALLSFPIWGLGVLFPHSPSSSCELGWPGEIAGQRLATHPHALFHCDPRILETHCWQPIILRLWWVGDGVAHFGWIRTASCRYADIFLILKISSVLLYIYNRRYTSIIIRIRMRWALCLCYMYIEKEREK